MSGWRSQEEAQPQDVGVKPFSEGRGLGSGSGPHEKLRLSSEQEAEAG